MDRIILPGMRFVGRHGVYDWEREAGQPFTVDLVVHVDAAAAGASDDLRDSVDYTALYASVRAVVEGPPRQLIEAVAAAIAVSVLAGFPTVQAVDVTVHKPRAVLGGPADGAAVRIRRARSGADRT